ncbi:hypothetical protein JAAARDRAFT_40874 [Jaapia argillacea MUCL 33604]|uniref:Uncharacterized protein n=1 Tax=Jaapia argillacea MUCL 33604 TaxID=933084 RepID=A0A067P9Q4_9AGAM|nr:hypothetical protein JAAARDRAFT_40874 [Jaapia argillacea MUCL 33604]
MPSQEPRIVLELDNDDVLDVVNHLNETYSITDGDSSFVSDQPGPGRTLDNFISSMGRRLENALGGISERFGNGPNAAMDRCLVGLDRAYHSRVPSSFYPIRSSKFLRRPPPLDQLLEDVFSTSYWWRRVEMCEDRVFINSCQRLISYLRSDKSGNQLLATYYLTALACCNPGIIPHLVQLDVLEALDAVRLQSLLRKDNRDESLLLASSRRALVMFSDSKALPVIKEFDLVTRKSWQHKCDLSAHSHPLLSNLLELSLNPETQILVAHHLIQNMDGLFFTDNTNILQPRLSSRILAEWVDHALSADPLCSAMFRSLIDELLEYSFVSFTNDALLSLLVCLLQRKIQGGNPEFISRLIDRLGREYEPNRPTSKSDLAHLREIISQPAHFDHLSIGTETFPKLREIASPSQEIWSSFCHYWNFPGVLSTYARSVPLRSIPSPSRTQLCRRLLALVLRGECPSVDISRVASHDVECRETLTQLLEKFATTSDVEADHIATLREILSSRPAPPLLSLFETKNLSRWCTGIYRGPDTCSQLRSVMVYLHDGYNGHRIGEPGSRSEPAPELLLGSQSSLRWTPVSDFITQENHRNPVRVTGDGHGRDTFIAGIPIHSRGEVGIFAIGSDLVVPEEWASLQKEELHILTGCSFNGQLAEVYWYNRGQHRFTNAFTLEECEAPEWIKSVDGPCFRCSEWWEETCG